MERVYLSFLVRLRTRSRVCHLARLPANSLGCWFGKNLLLELSFA